MKAKLDDNGQPVYYRSLKGSKRHASYYCLAGRKRPHTGEQIRIPLTDLGGWLPCLFCCDAEDMALVLTVPAPAKPAQCRNSGVVRPGRLYSECRDCGKEGKVNRNTGSLRAHAPLNAAAAA